MEKLFHYSPEIQSIPQIRKDLEQMAREWELPSTELRQIILIIEEIFSSTVFHFGADDPGHPLEVRIFLEGNWISMEMISEGIPFNPLEYHPARAFDPASLDDGGMGTTLVRTFADSFEYFREGNLNHLVIRKTIRKRQQESL